MLDGHVFVCVRVWATMSTLFFLLAMDFSYAKFHVWLNDVVLFSFVVMCVSVCAIRVERDLSLFHLFSCIKLLWSDTLIYIKKSMKQQNKRGYDSKKRIQMLLASTTMHNTVVCGEVCKKKLNVVGSPFRSSKLILMLRHSDVNTCKRQKRN